MLRLENISKSFKTGDFIQHALNNVSLEFRENEFVAILGPSGSGKTTLLNIIGGLDRYDQGDLIINGKSTKEFKDVDWDAYRNNSIGFIFQNYNLINHISVLNNVEMCMTLSGVSSKERKRRAKEALEKVGLKDHMHKKPNQLSGGQMQRVAIARALTNDPDIILADEPTGALDTETSVQIMELIKEIAKDKLVIMVTHNPELAENYATRVIKLKDGNLLEDSNPIDKNEKNKVEYKINKTSMKFFTALNLSFNNIKTKKGRTILTAFASSIGIIGIALILSLSNGFDKQIDKFEKETLSQMPIVISEQSMSVTEDDLKTMQDDIAKTTDDSYKDEQIIHPQKTIENLIHTNNITNEYKNYIENADQNLIGGICYNRATKLNVLVKVDSEIKMVTNTNMFFPIPEKDGSAKNSNIMTDNFDVIYGKLPENMDEIVILIDTKNRIDSKILEAIGYKDEENIEFEDIVGKEFKVILNDELYNSLGQFFTINTDYEKLYNSENAITLKITGIIRGKEDNEFAKMSGNGFIYTEDLMKYIIEKNNQSEIVKAQDEKDYNILTGEKFDLTTKEGKREKENMLAYLGKDLAPVAIQIYPKDFDTKDKLVEYLDEYNADKEDDDKVLYTDYAQAITTLSGNIMDAITVVLIAFSAISLVVSSIMIGIITYISVLERTKEIGILRALGARKKDITRVFNAETFIIGVCSGAIGILITNILIIPTNIIIENLTELPNVAVLNPIHAIILIIISILLTLIGGFIPAKIASRKDPVDALRTE